MFLRALVVVTSVAALRWTKPVSTKVPWLKPPVSSNLSELNVQKGLCKTVQPLPFCYFRMETGQDIMCRVEEKSLRAYGKWVQSTARVLELGARYGQTGCALSSMVMTTGDVVSVEPDRRVWEALEDNKKRGNCNKMRIVKGVVGNRGGKTVRGGYYQTKVGLHSEIPNFEWSSLGVPFDTLLSDCEGCFATFLDENPGLENTLNMIIVEAHDDGERLAIKQLLGRGWTEVDADDPVGGGPVWGAPCLACAGWSLAGLDG